MANIVSFISGHRRLWLLDHMMATCDLPEPTYTPVHIHGKSDVCVELYPDINMVGPDKPGIKQCALSTDWQPVAKENAATEAIQYTEIHTHRDLCDHNYIKKEDPVDESRRPAKPVSPLHTSAILR